jgi:2-keto-4-pentenoate hydratase/2-oxohepta-3-ene-1,7-dioic acid hydratase in catechol pathway
MKLASFVIDGRRTYGIVRERDVIDLRARLGDTYPDLRAWLDGGSLSTLAALADAPDGDAALSAITWLPTVTRPDKILCIGLNYKAHIREVGRKVEDFPVIFLRLETSHVGHLQPIIRPRISQQFDYEGELAVIIGKGGRYISADRALEHVAGYSIYNDGSVRDWQRHTHQYTPGKNFPGSGAFGPWLVTSDEIADPASLHLTTRLNGAVVQDSGIDDLLFDVPSLIAYCSTFTTLTPGDVIVTGTPGGVGAARKPPLWMKPGDSVDVEISAIGTLSNFVGEEG